MPTVKIVGDNTMADKLIITSALTGAITIPTQTPYRQFTSENMIAATEAILIIAEEIHEMAITEHRRHIVGER